MSLQPKSSMFEQEQRGERALNLARAFHDSKLAFDRVQVQQVVHHDTPHVLLTAADHHDVMVQKTHINL